MSKMKTRCVATGFGGASDVTRTRDLLITSEMHYRLCYTSDCVSGVIISRKIQIVNSFLRLSLLSAGKNVIILTEFER